MLPAELKQFIYDTSIELGFSHVGFSSATNIDKSSYQLKQWIDNEFHASMKWMKNSSEERADIFKYFPKAKTIQRVIYYLDQTVPDWRTQIDDCFFGHTHMPFHNHPQEGIRFHNTGSAITGMGFHPISFKLTDYHPSASGT